MKRASFFVVTVALGVIVLVFACSDPGFASYCTGIPAGGCPSDDPDTCVHDAGPDGEPGDPSCAAIYSHTPDCMWTLVQTCPGYIAPKDASETRDAADDSMNPRVTVRDAGFPLPDGAAGGPGCGALQEPDCPLAEAFDCGQTCCDCQTLYVCVNGGWNVWGECGDGGAVVPASP
jgi:hypothetical protein